MKPSITDYTDAEIRLGEQGRLSETEGYWWVCLDGHEDEGPFDTHELAAEYLRAMKANQQA